MNFNLNTHQCLELFGSSLSLIFNLFLLYIIQKFSRPEYGSYKFLMLVMTFLYVIYSAIEVVVLPSYFLFEYNYFLFTTTLTKYQTTSQVLITTFCAVFGCIQVVLACQFIYRYLSVANYNFLREKYFKGKRHCVWIILTFLFFTNWFLVAWFVFGNQGDHPKELEDEVWNTFGRNVSEMAFTLLTYAQLDSNGKVGIKLLDISMILYLLSCASIPMIISLTCGLLTAIKIRDTISLAQKSHRLQKQERQLFFALVLQFSIPFLGNTLPMLILFLCPALHISTEPYTNYVCLLISIYPVFDSVATTFVIKDYYRGVLRLLGLSNYLQDSTLSNAPNAPPNTLFNQGPSVVSIEMGNINYASVSS